MKSISIKDLEELLYAVNASTLISFTAVTDAKLRKRDNPHANARKVTIGTGVICWTYSRTVNRQRARELKRTDFKALRRKWGKKIKGCPLVRHVAADGVHLYLEIKCERRAFHWFDPKTKKRIEFETIAEFIPDTKTNPRQQLDREVVLRDYELDSIAEITIRNERYTVAPAVKELHRYFPAPKPVARRPRRTTKTAKQPKRGAT